MEHSNFPTTNAPVSCVMAETLGLPWLEYTIAPVRAPVEAVSHHAIAQHAAESVSGSRQAPVATDKSVSGRLPAARAGTERIPPAQASAMQGIQLGLIAKLGQQALCATDLNALLASAVAAVIEGLAADCCRVLRIGAAGQPAVVESGAGWDEGRLDHEWVESVAGTRIGHLIEHGEPLLVETHPSGCRFAPDEVLAAHGIRSGLELLIGGPGAPWGILGAYARQPRLYSPECVNFLHGIANILGFAFERTKAAEKLAFLVEYDALTGLPNRDVFRERLAHTIAGAERAGQMVGILYIDLEGFKGVNDSRGRDTGDRLMGLVAERLQSCVAGSGVVGRVGGDEFAIAISDLADSDDVDLMAEIVVEQLAQPFDLDGQEALIVASIGIAMFPLDGTAADVLLRNAEFAMHQGREQSRGSFQNRMIDLDGDL